MADILSAITVANESVALCSQAVALLKRFSHDVSNATRDLQGLLEHVERLKNSERLIQMVLSRLLHTGHRDLSLAFNNTALRSLIEEIIQRASELAGRQPSLGLYRSLRWAVGRSKMEDLVQRLEALENEAMQTVAMVTAYCSRWSQLDVLCIHC